MYRIGILADTHGATPPDLYESLSGVDCIFHAGDLGNPDVLLDLQVIAPVYAVRGNIDFFEFSRQLPQEQIVTIGEVSFAITHGDRYPQSLIHRELLRRFQPENVDVIIFGHTHRYYLKRHGRIWLANPGTSHCTSSPTGIVLTYENKTRLHFQKIQFHRNRDEETR